MRRSLLTAALSALAALMDAPPARALDGGVLQAIPRNGWKAFEVISYNQNPPGDGYDYALPSSFDGLGAWLPDAATLRVQMNHETSDASVSETNLDLAALKTAIANTIATGNTGGVSFVRSARQAYDRWSNDGGLTWTETTNTTTTAFSRFCSGQSYLPHTFGPNRGFVDQIYITGEEGGSRRLIAIDSVERDFYRLSGVAGGAAGGLPGMPSDSWENAALVDTGNATHIALLLSPDGGSQQMKMYIGEKGKDANGNPSSSFLARNGLAYGSYYYLNDALPATGVSLDGTFDTTPIGALNSTKLEDVDTSPVDPTQVVLGDQDSGLFTFDFELAFAAGAFDAATSSFSITRVLNHVDDRDGSFGDADNVDWTAATTLGGVYYPHGLLLVNEDSGTANGETWMCAPDGSGLTLIADNVGIATASESSGILDVSALVGYRPGSIVLTDNQGTIPSLTVLINPLATLVPEPHAAALLIAAAAATAGRARRRRR